uniref:Glycine cleavage system P protein n=1 Tax=Alexandrium catenella TaxID=2925 RepID=A0A7S1S2H2_ALECA|mmetsp:Transcript_8349/g.22615  ORF Transcript_8349/g.22615 Transcript_8349/m.22615 type:complete len:1017 (+) Transcript_8349:68-3118(+)
MLSKLVPAVESSAVSALRSGPARRAIAASVAQAAGHAQRQGPRWQLPGPCGSVRSAASSSVAISKELFVPADTFIARHLGPSPEAVAEMCAVMGVKDIDELIEQTIPAAVRRELPLDLPDYRMGEAGALALLKSIVSKNVIAKNFIGMGYHGTIVPGTILRNLLENPGWYTAYTPYQAEISQGRLESLVNYQTLVCELTGMEVSNSSLLDEGTAAAEAMAMIARTVNSKQKMQFFVSDKVHPQSIEVMKTRAHYFGMELIIGDHETTDFASMTKLCGALVQYPDTTGKLHDFTAVGEALHKNKAHLVVAADPLALVAAKPPSEFGADVVVGSMQRFGVPMWFGGPSAAFFATSKKQVRRMPGRLIGESVDRLGNSAYRLTLQTREQHIRLDKATSNVCTAQVLLANMAGMYAVYHRSDGLQHIARRVHGLAQLFTSELQKVGVPLPNPKAFFDTVALDVSPACPATIVEQLQAKELNCRALDAKHLTVSFDESHAEADVHALVAALKAAGVGGTASATTTVVDGNMPAEFARTGPFLQQNIFNSIWSETEMMRYMHTLQLKDLALDKSMISLGSCTMKLNSVSSLAPCSWPEISDMHPFAPASQTKGYVEMLESLEKYLVSCTGFDGCSLQPTSGASGEYAGLLVIRKYLETQGQGHRNVCIIPRSAHGTNPASAAMCDMQIKWIDDSKGMDLDEFRQMCQDNKDSLAALMVTYPSTRAFFEDNIQEICQIVHDNGGQVYMDGANMNAQLGLTSPGMIGADVCHLNLHKTFSIPHGGGGPGLGPICVRKHLVPHLPNHTVVSPSSGGDLGPVSAAPWGQAGIASIPWMFCTMLGVKGVTDSAKYAILNANYMKARLAPHFTIVATNANDRCSHEFILDCSDLRRKSGIAEEDIAKRLQDYGFHAPTMSWPVPHSLMVEPTESEDKAELDRFCDAMISIREEIRKIENGTWPAEDNPLKMAPHTQSEVCASEWNHPYSREEAAFPVPWLLQRGKFWPSVARVDNSLGDRKLKLRLEK